MNLSPYNHCKILLKGIFCICTAVIMQSCATPFVTMSSPMSQTVSNPTKSSSDSSSQAVQSNSLPSVKTSQDVCSSSQPSVLGAVSDEVVSSSSSIVPPPAPAAAALTTRATALTIRSTVASGEKVSSSGGATIDCSNASEGYVMIKYSGNTPKVKLQITGPNSTTYTYSIRAGGYEAFPLTSGNGSYTINVYENVSGNQYALAMGTSVTATLTSSLSPYLYPSQYVSFNSESKAVAKGEALAAQCTTQLAVVEAVYNYVIKNVTYDDYKASTVKSGYLPDVDSTLSTKKGICFDYAALMATMLRTQNIPTRLEVGYVSGGIYHAWISVYTAETGWINGIISFDGKSWKLMDPTFASNGSQSKSIMQFIGNGSNYSLKYVY